MEPNNTARTGFLPYALAAFLIGIVGGFSTVLGPAFVQDIGINYHNTTWTTLAQAMSTSACAPILGNVGDRIGRRVTLLLGIAVFTLGNLLSALAHSLAWMVAARFVVGIGAAAITPVILSYIVTQFPTEQVANGFSRYMLISSASVILGPTLGSLMIAAFGWRPMQWACVTICAAVLACCLALPSQPETPCRTQQNFDSLGAGLVVLFFSLMLCIPAFGQNFGWTSRTFLSVLLASVLSLAGLIWAERRAVSPILPGRFMRRQTFLLSVLSLFLTLGLMQVNITNTIVFVNYTQPARAAISGYAISAMYLGMSLGAVILGPMADRLEPKDLLIGSFLLAGLGCGMQYGFTAESSVFLLMTALGILGFGLGGTGTIFLKVVLSGLPPAEAGAGTGTYGLFRDLAAPFGAAVLVPRFTNQITRQIAAGAVPSDAAVRAMHQLAGAELLCIAAAILVVSALPRIHTIRPRRAS